MFQLIAHSSWTDRVRNEEILRRVKEERNIAQKKKEDQLDWSHLAKKLPPKTRY